MSLSSAALLPHNLLINSAGIQWRFIKGPALADVQITSPVCALCSGVAGTDRCEVTETTWGRQCLYKANINCGTSSENNRGQDTECALIHISIVCPPLLLLLWAWSISGVKEGGEWRRRGSNSGGSGGLAVFFPLCLCANAQTVQ